MLSRRKGVQSKIQIRLIKGEESEAMIESMEECIAEVKDYQEKHTKECDKVSHQDKEIIELCDKLSKRDVEAQEYRAMKEH